MKCLVYILNDSKLMPNLLAELSEAGITGCTVLDSKGVGRELVKRHDVFQMMFGSLKGMLSSDLEGNKTLIMVLEDQKVQVAVDAIEKTVGDLNEIGAGIAFTFDLDFVKGFKG